MVSSVRLVRKLHLSLPSSGTDSEPDLAFRALFLAAALDAAASCWDLAACWGSPLWLPFFGLPGSEEDEGPGADISKGLL